jgi:chromosomal replication initiator protein
MNDFSQVWPRIRQHLRLKLGATQFAYWLENLTPISADASRVILATSSRFERDRIVQLYGDLIAKLIADEAPGLGSVEFVVTAQQRSTSGNTALALRQEPLTVPVVVPGSIPLNKLYTFENFVVGAANEIAVSQARQTAESETALANPLFLFGGTGLGKTHVIQAICHHALERNSTKRVLYITAEWFLGKFVAAVRSGDTHGFKSFVRDVDLLAIDDLHMIVHKEKTIDEFLHCFDAVVDAGKQVVLSADRSPALLEDLSDRLRSRLVKGMSIEIKSSDFDLRLAILEAKAARIARENPSLAIGSEALRFIAQRINANTRELEGALHRVVSHSNGGGPATLANLQSWLADFLKLHDRRVTIEEIKVKTASFFGCRVDDLESPSRTRDIVRRRQIAMFMARKMTNRSLPDIARRFNKKDHTTVIHAVKIIEALIQTDPDFAQTVESLRLSIRSWPANAPLH